MGHSKTEEAGTAHNPYAQKPIVGVAAEALTCWLEASEVKPGAIFRRIRGSKAGEPLSGQAVTLSLRHLRMALFQRTACLGSSTRTPGPFF